MSTSQKTFAVAWLVLVVVSLWGSSRPEFAGSDPLGLPANLQQWQSAGIAASGTEYHEMYLDPSSLKVRKSGGQYPDGTRLVLAVYEASSRNKLRNYQVMTKDSQLFSKTGGWGFAKVTPDGRRDAVDVQRDCWSCHSGQTHTDHTFSIPALEQAWIPATSNTVLP